MVFESESCLWAVRMLGQERICATAVVLVVDLFCCLKWSCRCRQESVLQQLDRQAVEAEEVLVQSHF